MDDDQTAVRIFKSIIYPAFHLLSPGDKKRGIGIIALMGLNAFLDFFSLASFLPLILLVVNPGAIFSNPYFSGLYATLGFVSPSWFILAFIGCLLLLVILKNAAALWITRAKARYCFNVGSNLSTRMLSAYMEVSYLQFTQLDFTKELNRITNLPIAFANNIVLPLANLLSEGLVLSVLLVCISIYDIKVVVLLLIIILPISFLYNVRRRGASKTSEDLKEKYPLTLKHALQAIEGLLDIKAFGIEPYFKRRFDESSQSLAKALVRDHVHQTSGTRLTEIIVAFIICALIAYTALTSQNNQQTFLLLGIYAGASFRMLPSLNRMLNAQMQIKSHEYLFQELNSVRDFKIFQNQKEEPSFRFEKTIELQNITFQYPAGAKVLDHASLTINKGDKIALVGKSGSGKTTVLLLILHFLKGEGKIRVDGREIHDENLFAWRRACSYVPQNPYILDGTIMENIAFGLSSADINVERIRELIRDLDLQEMLDQLPEGLSTQIGERGIKLSGGQRQRIAIARALYGGAEVLLFDEITNQLDARTEMEIIHTLEKVAHQKKTILMITHHDHLLKEFGRILSLENGVISEMSPVQTSHG